MKMGIKIYAAGIFETLIAKLTYVISKILYFQNYNLNILIIINILKR